MAGETRRALTGFFTVHLRISFAMISPRSITEQCALKSNIQTMPCFLLHFYRPSSTPHFLCPLVQTTSVGWNSVCTTGRIFDPILVNCVIWSGKHTTSVTLNRARRRALVRGRRRSIPKGSDTMWSRKRLEVVHKMEKSLIGRRWWCQWHSPFFLVVAAFLVWHQISGHTTSTAAVRFLPNRFIQPSLFRILR